MTYVTDDVIAKTVEEMSSLRLERDLMAADFVQTLDQEVL